jgi:hypothetical protein
MNTLNKFRGTTLAKALIPVIPVKTMVVDGEQQEVPDPWTAERVRKALKDGSLI